MNEYVCYLPRKLIIESATCTSPSSHQVSENWKRLNGLLSKSAQYFRIQ